MLAGDFSVGAVVTGRCEGCWLIYGEAWPEGGGAGLGDLRRVERQAEMTPTLGSMELQM